MSDLDEDESRCERLVEAWPREGYAPTIFRRCGKPAEHVTASGRFVCADCAPDERSPTGQKEAE